MVYLKEELFIKAEEVAVELGISRDYAYRIIRKLNKELEEMGYITLPGRVNRHFYKDRLYMPGQK